jgi:carbonic anhydrase
MATGTFATVFGCIDGRVSVPTITYLKQFLPVDYVDYISEPGPDKVFLQGTSAQISDIQRKLAVSLDAHHSHTIAVVAHHDCAGNPVSREEHLAAVRMCASSLASWQPNVRVLGLWVNDQWQVERVCDTSMAAQQFA